MADALLSFDITVGDIFYVLFVKSFKSLGKGVLNSVHLRQRHQCVWCQVLNEETPNGETRVEDTCMEDRQQGHLLVSGVIV